MVYLPGDPGPPVHLRQRADGSVLVGEHTQETVATDPVMRHARALVAQAARLFPVLAGVAREVADQVPDGLLAPFRPGRFAERATQVMLQVESVFREPPRQDRST